MSSKTCKACGRALPKTESPLWEWCPYCGHRISCSGCGSCQHCPLCGEDRHEGDCKSEIELPRPDLVAYLEMARIALGRDDMRDQLIESMDLSDEELARLSKQLNDYLEETTS